MKTQTRLAVGFVLVMTGCWIVTLTKRGNDLQVVGYVIAGFGLLTFFTSLMQQEPPE